MISFDSQRVYESLRVTPSPESMTTPVNVLSLTLDEVHEAARAKTAWTAMYLFSLVRGRITLSEELTVPGR